MQKTRRTVISGKLQNLYNQIAEFRISILFQYFMNILAKFNTFSRSWKQISKSNTFNTAWKPCLQDRKMTLAFFDCVVYAPKRFGMQETACARKALSFVLFTVFFDPFLPPIIFGSAAHLQQTWHSVYLINLGVPHQLFYRILWVVAVPAKYLHSIGGAFVGDVGAEGLSIKPRHVNQTKARQSGVQSGFWKPGLLTERPAKELFMWRKEGS